LTRSKIEEFQAAAGEIANFLKPRLAEKIQIKVNTHTDPDGISAGNLFARALNYYDVPHHVSFGGPPEKEDVEKLEKQDYELFVFLDQGTGQFELIEEHLLDKDREVLILDHHPGEIRETPNLSHLNPLDFGLEGTKEVSSSGVVYSVLKELDDHFEPLSIIALIGALGDRQNLPSGFTGVNEVIEEKAIEEGHIMVREGLKLNGRSLPLAECLTRSTRPFLFGLSGDEESARDLIEDLGLDSGASLEELDEEEEEELRAGIMDRIEATPTESLENALWGTVYRSEAEGVFEGEYLHEYVTLLDACEKPEREEVGFAALFGDEDAGEEAGELLKNYQERMIGAINWFVSGEDRVKVMENVKLVDAGSEIGTGMMGEVLSVAIESGVIGDEGPTIALTDLSEDRVKVSARAGPDLEQSEKHLGDVMNEASMEFGGDGGGHKTAAAAHIPRESKEKFVEKVNMLLEEDD